MATIGEQIREARKAKGMTQSKLAGCINMSRQGVSHWEQGRTLPDAETLLRLSRILGYNFEANQTEDNFGPEAQYSYSIAVEPESGFPFLPSQVIALLKREGSADPSIPAQAAQQLPESQRPPVQVFFRTNDKSVTEVECLLIGHDRSGNTLQCRTQADLLLE